MEIIKHTKIHGKVLELYDNTFKDNEEVFVLIRRKKDSIVEATKGKEIDDKLIDEIIELTEIGE
ncbi:MAG: hypothetical protein ACE5J3_10195 [Methanosarcinales archaeon]